MAETTTITRSATGTDHNKPTFTAPAYEAMAPRWKMCREVYRGNEALREDANLDTYYPKGPAESPEERLARVMRTDVFPMFKETVKGLTGLALREDPELGSDVPQELLDLAENIDGAGTHFGIFTKRLFSDGLIKGHAGILVDVPKVSSSKPLTLGQEKALGLRPYWVHIKAEQIINWRTQTINGSLILTLLVLAEIIDVPMGDYGTQTTTRYRVFRRDDTTGQIKYEVWTVTSEHKDPELDDFGFLRGSTLIPFVAFYAGERIAPLQSIPPLLDLAYTNISHAQVLSDHRTCLHACGNPILVIKGRTGGNVTRDPNIPLSVAQANPLYSTEGPGAGVQAGSDDIVVGPHLGIEVDKDGDVTYAEPTGAALNASAKELNDIENRGAAQGLSMLQRDVRAAQTAEAERLQRSEKDASLSTAARSLEDCLEMALAFTAEFMQLPTGGSVTLNKDFEKVVVDTPRIQALSSATAAGQFTLRTFWKMIGSSILPEDFNADAEETALNSAAAVTLANNNGVPGTTPAQDTGSGGAPPAGGGGQGGGQ